jgi:hypothetical protein
MSHVPPNLSWEQTRIMQHLFTRNLPDPSESSPEPAEPWLDRIDDRYRARAAYFLKFGATFAQLGALPGELRLSIEPLHPLLLSDVARFVRDKLRTMGVAQPTGEYGLSAISRALIDLYNPAADLFSADDVKGVNDDLFLFDPITGFVIWKQGDKPHNFWLGNQADLVTLQTQSEPLRSLLVKSPSDNFSLGGSLLKRLVGPLLRKRREFEVDPAGIVTMTVTSQKDLEGLADDLRNACEISPLNLTVVFRGQTDEYLLPDRKDLVARMICPYSDVRDHSVVPSMYRHIDRFLDKLTDFRDFAGHLLDWGLWSDLVFGDPVTYQTLDGHPYVPKEPPAEAYAKFELYFLGDSGDSRIAQDLGPATKWTITDTTGAVLDEYIKLHRPGFDSVRRNLVLQHYGAPTPFVDVTHDIRIAEWFALNQIGIAKDGLSTSGRVGSPFSKSIIFAFLVLDGLTPFVNTEELVTPEQSLRPHRQACALLGGSGNLYRNAASRFIALKIRFADGFVPRGMPNSRHLFPGPDEDNTLKRLLERYELPGNSRLFPVYWFPEKG